MISNIYDFGTSNLKATLQTTVPLVSSPPSPLKMLPFSTSSISSNKPFELIHCDIWGPFKAPSFSGAKYFLTIVDDFSRFTWVFLMHHKSETKKFLTNFFSYVKTQFNTTIKNIWVDNGGKFFSMQEFFFPTRH